MILEGAKTKRYKQEINNNRVPVDSYVLNPEA